ICRAATAASQRSTTLRERRKLERHPTTGAAQLVEIRERVREIEVTQYVVAEPRNEWPSRTKPLLFDSLKGRRPASVWRARRVAQRRAQRHRGQPLRRRRPSATRGS